MKILEVRQVTKFIVQTDCEDWSTYRTDGKGNWEILMGNSWEDHYFDEELQQAWEDYHK